MTAHKTTTHDGVRWGRAYSSTWCDQCNWTHTSTNKQEAAQAAEQHSSRTTRKGQPIMGVMETTCDLCGEWFYPMSPGKLCGGNRCYKATTKQNQAYTRRITNWLMKP